MTPPPTNPSLTPSPAEPARDTDEPEPEPSPAPGGDADLQVDLLLKVPDTQPPAAGWLDVMLTRAARVAQVPVGSAVTVTVVDDAEMAPLHATYKNVAGTTDVLTFDLSESPGGAIEGDLVVCVDEARRQAAARGHEVRVELLLYAVHGLLHLLGEDDHDPVAYERMHRREDALLEAIGVGVVFDRPDARGPSDDAAGAGGFPGKTSGRAGETSGGISGGGGV